MLGKKSETWRSSVTELSLCSSAVHLGTDPRAACDPNGAPEMIRLTTLTEVYTPYQGSEGGKSFLLLKDWFLTAHCSPQQREPNKDLTKIWTLVCTLVKQTTRIPTECSFYSTERMFWGLLLVVCHHRKPAQVFLLKEELADKATFSSAAIHLPPDGFGGGIYQPLALGDASSSPPLLHSCSGLSLAM